MAQVSSESTVAEREPLLSAVAHQPLVERVQSLKSVQVIQAAAARAAEREVSKVCQPAEVQIRLPVKVRVAVFLLRILLHRLERDA